MTRAQLIAKADAVCVQLNAQLAANVVNKANSFAVALPQAAAYEHAESVQLAKLVSPSSMAKDWHSFLAETQRWAQDTAKLGAAARAGHFNPGSPLVTLATKTHSNLVSIAKRAGFKQCSELEE